MLETIVVEIQKQLVGIKIIEPLNIVTPTIGVETIVTPNTNFVRGGVLIGSTTNLGHGSNEVSMGRNLSMSLKLSTTTIGVVRTPYVATLTLGAHDQGKGLQRCGPKVKPMSHISCSHECRRVRE